MSDEQPRNPGGNSKGGQFAAKQHSEPETVLVLDSIPTLGPDGTRFYYLPNGRLHRLNAPAIERVDGTREWYFQGELHREDGPAIEYPDGGQRWLRYGVYHREDGPAVIEANGHEEHWRHGRLHRANGPAVTYPSGETEYWTDGELRASTPATMFAADQTPPPF